MVQAFILGLTMGFALGSLINLFFKRPQRLEGSLKWLFVTSVVLIIAATAINLYRLLS